MKSSIIVGIIVVVIIVFGGWFLLKSGNSGEEVLTPTPAVTDQATVVPLATADMTASVSPLPSTSPSASPTTVSGATVTITDTGFSPASITVKPGTTVTFVNNGQGAHWPASDPHPTHTGLQGFDAKHGLATGESYSFVFQKMGTWGYHDHLNARMTGMVVVQP